MRSVQTFFRIFQLLHMPLALSKASWLATLHTGKNSLSHWPMACQSSSYGSVIQIFPLPTPLPVALEIRNGPRHGSAGDTSDGVIASMDDFYSIFLPFIFHWFFDAIFDRPWLDFPSQLVSQNRSNSLKNKCQDAFPN